MATGPHRQRARHVPLAFAHAGLNYEDHVAIDPVLAPGRGRCAAGRRRQGKAKLGWTPTTSLEELIAEMVEADLAGIATGSAAVPVLAPSPASPAVTGAAGFVGGHLLPVLRRSFPEHALIAALQPGAASRTGRG